VSALSPAPRIGQRSRAVRSEDKGVVSPPQYAGNNLRVTQREPTGTPPDSQAKTAPWAHSQDALGAQRTAVGRYAFSHVCQRKGVGRAGTATPVSAHACQPQNVGTHGRFGTHGENGKPATAVRPRDRRAFSPCVTGKGLSALARRCPRLRMRANPEILAHMSGLAHMGRTGGRRQLLGRVIGGPFPHVCQGRGWQRWHDDARVCPCVPTPKSWHT
jgi:hypothetical protein